MRNHEQTGPGTDSFCFYEDIGAVDLVAFAEAWASLSAEVAGAIAAYIEDASDGLLQQRDQKRLDLDESARLEAIKRVGGWNGEIDALLGYVPQAELPSIADDDGRILPR
jgi:hypothetical protein